MTSCGRCLVTDSDKARTLPVGLALFASPRWLQTNLVVSGVTAGAAAHGDYLFHLPARLRARHRADRVEILTKYHILLRRFLCCPLKSLSSEPVVQVLV